MDRAELELLAKAQPNPFAGSVVRNGFEAPLNDVAEIHAEQRKKLRALVEEVRRSGELVLQVVTGEPGDGKTHLLATLRAEAEDSWRRPGTERAMVPIDPLRDPDSPFSHILQGLVRGLRRPFSLSSPVADSPGSPLEHILWRILRRAVQSSPHPACAEAASLFGPYPSATVVLLQQAWPRLEPVLRGEGAPNVDPDFWTVLCRFPAEPQLAMRWLGGGSLPEEELKAIGVSHPLDGEDRAFSALSSLLLLSEVPIVLGFDQLEGITRLGDRAVENFLQALADQLYSSGGRAAVLLFCQADAWNTFAGRLQRQVQDRLMQRPYLHLGALDPALGEKLIARRLEAMWRGLGVLPPYPTFPFPEGFVRESIVEQSLKGPRRILSWFAARGLEPAATAPGPAAPPAPAELARAEYERLRSEPPVDHASDEAAAIAQAALCTVFEKAKTLGDTAVVAARRARRGFDVKLARAGKEVSVHAEASNSANGMAAKAVAKRLQESLGKADRALLIRDERIAVPPVAGRLLADLGERACIVRIDEESHRAFSAIERLLNGAAARDIEVPLEVAIQVVVEQIAPQLAAVRKFLDAATAPPAAPGPSIAVAAREALVLAALLKPPFVASELQLAKAHGVAPEEIAEASDALERAGKAVVRRGKDGGRVVMRRVR